MTQIITKIIKECFDIISKDSSTMNDFKNANKSIAKWSHTQRVANYYENLVIKSETYQRYDIMKKYHDNAYFALKQLLDKDLKQNNLKKQNIITKVKKTSVNANECITHLVYLKGVLQTEKVPQSQDDKKSHSNTKKYLQSLIDSLQIVNGNLDNIVQRYDEFVRVNNDKPSPKTEDKASNDKMKENILKTEDLRASLNKIKTNAQELSKQTVIYAHKGKNTGQYMFTLDENYKELKKANQELIIATDKIINNNLTSSDDLISYINDAYEAILSNVELANNVKKSLADKTNYYNIKVTQEHVNSLKKYIADIQTQIQLISKNCLPKQLQFNSTAQQKPSEVKPNSQPIQSPIKSVNSENQNSSSKQIQKIQSSTSNKNLGPLSRPGLSDSQVSGNSSSKFSDIKSVKSDKSAPKQDQIEQQKIQATLSKLLNLISQNDGTLSQLLPKLQYLPTSYQTISLNHIKLISVQQKNNKAVQIAIDLLEKHQNGHHIQKMNNFTITQQDSHKIQANQEVDDTKINISPFYSEEDLENARKEAEEKIRKYLTDQHKQTVVQLEKTISNLTLQLSIKQTQYEKQLSALTTQINHTKQQLSNKIAEIQIQSESHNLLSNQLENLKTDHKTLNQLKIKLENDNNKLKEDNELVQKQLALQKQNLVECTKLSNQLKNQIEKLKQEIDSLTKQKETLNQTVQSKQLQLEQMTRLIKQSSQKTSANEAQKINKIQEIQAHQENTIETIKPQSVAFNQSISMATSQQKNDRGFDENKPNSIQSETSANREFQASIDNQQQSKTILKNQFDSLASQINSKKYQLECLCDKETQKQSALTQLENKLLDRKRQQDKINHQIDLLKQRIKQKQAGIVEQQKKYDQIIQTNANNQAEQVKLSQNLKNLQDQYQTKKIDLSKLQSQTAEYERKLLQFKQQQQDIKSEKIKIIQFQINSRQQKLKDVSRDIFNMISSVNISKLREQLQLMKKQSQIRSSINNTVLNQQKQKLSTISKALDTASEKLSLFEEIIQKKEKLQIQKSQQSSNRQCVIQKLSEYEVQSYLQLFKNKVKTQFQLVVQELKIKMLEYYQQQANFKRLLADADSQKTRGNKYKEQIRQLQKTKEQKNKQNTQLIQSRQKIQDDIRKLKQQYQSLIITQFKGVKQTTQYESTISRLQKEIQTYKQKSINLQTSLKTEKQKSSSFSNSILTLTQNLKSLQSTHKQSLEKVTDQMKYYIDLQQKSISQKQKYDSEVQRLRNYVKSLQEQREEELRKSKVQIGKNQASKFAREVQKWGAAQAKQVQQLKKHFEDKAATLQSQVAAYKRSLQQSSTNQRKQYQSQITSKVNSIISQFNKTNTTLSQQRKKYNNLYRQIFQREQYLNLFLKKIYGAFIYYNNVDKNILTKEEKEILTDTNVLKEQQARNVLAYVLETIQKVQYQKQVRNKIIAEANQNLNSHQIIHQQLNDKINQQILFIDKLTSSKQFQKDIESLKPIHSSGQQFVNFNKLRNAFISFAKRTDQYLKQTVQTYEKEFESNLASKLQEKEIETTTYVSSKEFEIQQLNAKISENQNQIQKLKKDLREAEETLTKNMLTYETERTNLLKEIEKSTSQLQQTVKNNTAQLIPLRKQKQDLETKYNNLQSMYQQLNIVCNNLQGEIGSLQDQKHSLEAQISKLNKKNQQFNANVSQQQSNLSRENNTLKEKIQTMSSDLKKVHEQIEIKKVQIKSLNDQLTRQKANSLNASKNNTTLQQVQNELNRSSQKIKELEASRIALQTEWKQKLEAERNKIQQYKNQLSLKEEQSHSLRQTLGNISNTLARKMGVNRQFTPDTILQAIESYSPPVGKVLITSTIMLGLDHHRAQIIAACEKFSKKTIKKSSILFRYPESRNMVTILTAKDFINSPFIIFYKTVSGWVVGSYSEAMKKPTFFFSFASEDYENRFESTEELRKLKVHMPQISESISSVEFVNGRFLQYGNGQFKISAIDLSNGTANSDVVSSKYYGYDWKQIFRDKNETKILLSEVEIHRIEFQ